MEVAKKPGESRAFLLRGERGWSGGGGELSLLG